MLHCPSCDYPLPDNRERLGARCPRCKDPLYEPAGRTPRPARPDESSCAVHAGQEAVGTCARCGNFLCEVCRTRWRDQVVCVACVDRALQKGEAAGGERGHLRQGFLSVILGATAWLALILMVVIANIGQQQSAAIMAIIVLFVLGAMFVGALLATLGLGQATAALRMRGSHMILATLGLILNGLFLGAFIGLLLFSMWFNP
jgi:hypothetical protein